ncbi:RNA ligase [Alteraurantiacibacter aquimixticola]|nr:RNA ligase [Alteraurantiacibacter aquimixticola]
MTTQSRHFARTITYDELTSGLEAARSEGAIYCRKREDGLLIWNYTNACVYDRMWGPFSLIARGLIIDPARREIVATPFPKFFNLGEQDRVFPDEPFEVFEKLDGSLIVLFHHDGRWQASTRGAFGTPQAVWAEAHMARFDLSALDPETTYLAEAIYPENRIIVSYDEEALVLLSAYDAEGHEPDFAALQSTAERIGWRTAQRYRFASAGEMVTSAEQLPEQEEGYVVRFASGSRLKVKSPAYCRLHAIINRITPLGIWDMFRDGDDLEAVRRSIPEELWGDFDALVGATQSLLDSRLAEVADAAARYERLSNKEIGLMRDEIPPRIFSYLFAYRQNPDLLSDGKAREKLMREIRPTGNVLEGYEPSSALTHIIGDAE